ncbi:hypothetical protein [Thioalkalivibrio paradoxus]|uniref:Uncharacterized protein n=1 Tax=Thioalkalivibrio paradoxus ARh 1 TaxID=713585 RepID=W0DPD8_9GAMM|nr:hypothetical protein [Thioalkalivibrio paradoxus]AHF00322.1 hypothetical protein THITH_16895 [Thioalkalivibrio paradoxus ARh 1]
MPAVLSAACAVAGVGLDPSLARLVFHVQRQWHRRLPPLQQIPGRRHCADAVRGGRIAALVLLRPVGDLDSDQRRLGIPPRQQGAEDQNREQQPCEQAFHRGTATG